MGDVLVSVCYFGRALEGSSHPCAVGFSGSTRLAKVRFPRERGKFSFSPSTNRSFPRKSRAFYIKCLWKLQMSTNLLDQYFWNEGGMRSKVPPPWWAPSPTRKMLGQHRRGEWQSRLRCRCVSAATSHASFPSWICPLLPHDRAPKHCNNIFG